MAEREEENIESPQQGGAGFRARLMRLVLGAVVLGLAASTLYLLAERNSRSYYLTQEGRRLVVSRGAWLPSGKRPYLPEDPHAAKVYSPVDLPEDAEPFLERRFDERQDLDRALFDLLASLADERIRSEDASRLQEGFSYVERASILPGISGEQAGRLRLLRAELSFFEGRAHLEQAMVQIRQAREKLELATEASSSRGQEASILLQRMAPAADLLGRALKRSKGWETGEDLPAPVEMGREGGEEAEPAPASPREVPAAAPRVTTPRDAPAAAPRVTTPRDAPAATPRVKTTGEAPAVAPSEAAAREVPAAPADAIPSQDVEADRTEDRSEAGR